VQFTELGAFACQKEAEFGKGAEFGDGTASVSQQASKPASQQASKSASQQASKSASRVR